MPDPQTSLYQTLFESIGDAVLALDSDGKIVLWNPAAERLYGWAKEEVLGMPFRQFLKTKYLNPLETHERVKSTVIQDGSWRGKVTQKHKNGALIVIESTIFPYQAPDYDGYGLVVINRDISKEETLRNTINRLEYLNRVLMRQSTGDDAFKTYIGQLKEIVPFDQADLWLINADHNEVQVAGRFAQNQFEFAVNERCPIKDTVLGLVRLTRQALIIADLQTRKNFKQKGLLHPESRALMALPLVLNSDVVGALVFMNRTDGVYQLEDADLLTTATEQLSFTLDKIQLLDSIHKKALENSQLLTIAQKKSEQLQEMSKVLIRL